MSWLANAFVPIIAGIIIWWLLSNIPKIAELGFKGAATVVIIVYALFLLFTNDKSPAKVVPIIDGGYVDVKGQVGESQLANDFAAILEPVGVDNAALGLNAAGNNEAAPDLAADTLNPNVATSQQPVTGTFGATAAMTGFGAPMTFQIPADKHITASDANGNQYDLAGQVVCLQGWNNDSTLSGCMNQAGWKVPYSTDFTGLPANPYTTATTTQQQPAAQLTSAQLGQCWLVFAGKYLTGEVEMAGQALPAGTTWTLTGPGGFTDGNFTTKTNEEWTLSNPDLGITDYPINGFLGRSFPRADDSGSVLVYGQNAQIQPACAQVQQ